MSEALLTQWRDRVLEAETEVGLVQDDIKHVHEQRKAIKADARKHTEMIDREKKELLLRLESVAAEAKELSTLCVSTLSAKDEVEATYLQTLDDYENMHYMVRDIKNDEENLKNREDFEQRLQRESLAWAEEEHALRTRLNQMQSHIKQVRKQQAVEVSELESELAALEARQRQERAERSGETRQHVRHALRRESRQPTPQVQAQARSDEESKAAADINAFVASHSGVSVPTRVNAVTSSNTGGALKSCLRSAVPASAPVSRAASQALLSASADPTMGGQQPSLAQMRAYSAAYASGKGCSRKRDILGESTNQQ